MRSLIRGGLACLLVGKLALGAELRDTSAYSFEEYQREFGRVYAADEHPMRAKLFAERLAMINIHNEEYAAGKHTWYMAVNRFTDRTEAEFQQVKMKPQPRRERSPETLGAAKPWTQASKKNAASVDWRKKGVVTPVKDQAACGSCWAFSATEVLESHYKIADMSRDLPVLAPQAFVNCVKNPDHCGGTGGCEGATMQLAFGLAVDKGLPLESEVPYQGRDQTCGDYTATVKPTGYVTLPHNNASALETALAEKGPISIMVAANWMAYGGGIFEGGCNDRGCTEDHGVAVVGYSKHYWIVRNSWGEGWGEDGYIRLTRQHDGDTYTDKDPASGDACKPYPATQAVGGESGMLTDCSYPTFDSADEASTIVV